jgi:hypothetical protein
VEDAGSASAVFVNYNNYLFTTMFLLPVSKCVCTLTKSNIKRQKCSYQCHVNANFKFSSISSRETNKIVQGRKAIEFKATQDQRLPCDEV